MSVLITSAHLRQGLIAARSLGRQGIAVFVAAPDRCNPTFYSRYVKRKFVLTSPGHSKEFISQLLHIVRKCNPSVILPMWDDDSIVLAKYRQMFPKGTVIPLAPYDTLLKAFNKGDVLKIAASLSIPVPKTKIYKSTGDIKKDIDRLEFPIVLKPAYQYVWHNNDFVRRAYVGYYIAHNKKALIDGLKDFSHLENHNIDILAQEKILGDGVGCEILMWEGKVKEFFMHKRLREFNPDGGQSVLRKSIYDSRLKEYAVKLLKKINWQGPAMVEFKYDIKKDDFVLMEINGRYWGSLALAVASGVPFPVTHYRLARKLEPVTTHTYQTGIRCRWLEGDLHRFGNDIRYGRQKWKTLKHFFRLHPKEQFDDISLDDPVPGMILFMFKLKRAFARIGA